MTATWAREVIDASDRFETSTAALREAPAARIRLAASLTIAEYLAPRWLATLAAGASSAAPGAVTRTATRTSSCSCATRGPSWTSSCRTTRSSGSSRARPCAEACAARPSPGTSCSSSSGRGTLGGAPPRHRDHRGAARRGSSSANPAREPARRSRSRSWQRARDSPTTCPTWVRRRRSRPRSSTAGPSLSCLT
ncbi:hypothetical protein NKG05_02915 [Oerskovia sp. M15]